MSVDKIVWRCLYCWLDIADGAGCLERDSWASAARPPAFDGWRAVHRGCDQEISTNTYWWAVERLRTQTDVDHAAEHMRSKRWWNEDEWAALLASPMTSAVQ